MAQPARPVSPAGKGRPLRAGQPSATWGWQDSQPPCASGSRAHLLPAASVQRAHMQALPSRRCFPARASRPGVATGRSCSDASRRAGNLPALLCMPEAALGAGGRRVCGMRGVGRQGRAGRGAKPPPPQCAERPAASPGRGEGRWGMRGRIRTRQDLGCGKLLYFAFCHSWKQTAGGASATCLLGSSHGPPGPRGPHPSPSCQGLLGHPKQPLLTQGGPMAPTGLRPPSPACPRIQEQLVQPPQNQGDVHAAVSQSNPSPAGWDGCAWTPLRCAQCRRAHGLQCHAQRASSSIPTPSRLWAVVPMHRG